MVVTKVFQIKKPGNLKNAINYIVNEAKTLKIDDDNNPENIFSYELKDGEVMKRLVSGYDLSDSSDPETIYEDFILTKMSVDAMKGNEQLSDLHNDKYVMAHHLIQSFSPEDNLTPEEIHEIGRKTVMELTGGHHQFVIATHMDKEHIHNHIIFNTTDNVTLKKFRWQKGTKKSLEQISDKHAGLAGAKIIQPTLRNSHTKYSAWKESNNFRFEIKRRLDFLMKHSTSLDDFLKKADALDLKINFSGKYATYQLKDKEQQRAVRDRTLSKKGKYSQEGLLDRFKLNGTVFSLEEIKDKYQEQVEKEEEDFEIKCEIEKWQVKGITPRQIYVDIDFGIDRKGTVAIPAEKLDQLDDGNFIAYLKNSDFFYFLNDHQAKDNKFVYGATVIKQLSQKNGELVLRKNPRISNLNQLVDELNFLSLNGVTNAQQFENLQNRFVDQLKATDQELDKLDEKVVKINKLAGALEDYQSSITPSEAAMKILDEARIDKTMDLQQLKKEIKELQIERNALKEVRDKIVSDYTFREKLDQKYNQRKSKSL